MPDRRFNELEDISLRLSANKMISKKSVHERLQWIQDEYDPVRAKSQED